MTKFLTDHPLPCDIVLSPSWWHAHEGICFDRDFYYHPARRVEAEQQMEKALYDRWGNYGLGAQRDQVRPELGAVHLAAGFLLSGMLGCEIEYPEDNPPQVYPAMLDKLELDVEKAFSGKEFVKLQDLARSLKETHGFICGDVNWGGILNIALDLRGETLFVDMFERPQEVKSFFSQIYDVITRFVSQVQTWTGTTSISVNRNVRNLNRPVFLHSACAYTMISGEMYREFLMPFDICWSEGREAFGIHYCGEDPHRFAAIFSELPALAFVDVGWGGDLKKLREQLPHAFLNIRLSPVEIVDQSEEEIENHIRRLVTDSADIRRTGVCCINMDNRVSDEKITTIFRTVASLREET